MIQLSIEEIREAVSVGVERVIDSIEHKRTPRFSYKPGDIWRSHISGALGEAALHKHTGWHWNKRPGIFRSKPDVGGCEVRWSGQSPPRLKVREDEQKEVLVLTSGDAASGLIIHGWLHALDAPALGDWLQDPPPAWFVHHARLNPIHVLIQDRKERAAIATPWGLEA